MKKSRLKPSAFTLLEIMLVVIIIGILVTMALRMVGGKVNEAQMMKARTEIQQFRTNLLMYQARNGFYPSSAQGLKALVQMPEGDPKPRNWSQLDETVPLDPWGKDYIYVCPGVHNTREYDIYSGGPDRNPDTEEDNVGNWEKAPTK